MDNLNQYRELEQLLRNESEFCTEDGHLLKNAIVEAALAMRPKLLRLLMSNEALRNNFFVAVDGIAIFDKVRFQKFVMNKRFLPDSYTSFKNKTGLVDDNENFIADSREVVLAWPFKDCMLEGGQTKEDAKRNEVFWNEILAPDEINRLTEPKALTKFRRYDNNGEQVATSVSSQDNFIIKGNNLLVLHSLMKKYRGRINLIYIDPPFNTANDTFSYNDNFTRSTWLTFMRNRLAVSKDLLTPDGNIFIHIDINQSHYLKVLADEVFGKENFVEEIIWAYGSPSGGRAATPKPVNIHDYILHYARNYSQRKQNRVYIPYTEKYIKEWFKYTDEDGRVYSRRQRGRDESGNAIWSKQYLDESKGVPLSTVWTDITQVYADPRAYKPSNTSDVEVIREFSGGQKPEALIARIIDMASDPGDIVLDYHLGTGTTAAVAHKMGRRYIGAEQMDSQIEIILKRLQKVIQGETAGISKKVNWHGGGSFVYCELAMANQRFVEQIEGANTIEELAHIWKDMQRSGFLSWKIQPKQIDENASDFAALSLKDQKHFLIECLDKNLLYVPLSEIDNDEFEISDEDKKLNKDFYSVD